MKGSVSQSSNNHICQEARVPHALLLTELITRLVPGWIGMFDRGLSFMQQAGIDPQRIVCRHLPQHPDLFASYNQVDITLDKHPYSGGITTLESLWMGVPVITLPGGTFASRHSASHLTRIGLEELIAGSEEDYISLAVNLARDLNLLSELRLTLRERMKNSVIYDGEKWTRAFEEIIYKTVGY